LIALTCVTYIPVLFGGFVWDDEYDIVANHQLHTLGGLVRLWTMPGIVTQYYPLTNTTFWIEYQLWGPLAAGLSPEQHSSSRNQRRFCSGGCCDNCRSPPPGSPPPFLPYIRCMSNRFAWIIERKNTLSGVLYLATMLARHSCMATDN